MNERRKTPNRLNEVEELNQEIKAISNLLYQFTEVQGTYNGVEALSRAGPYHFTALINPGMRGGRALVSSGVVFAISAARRNDGDSMGFLVPAQSNLQRSSGRPEQGKRTGGLLGEARQGKIDGQERITADRVGSQPRTQRTGLCIVPVQWKSASRFSCGSKPRRQKPA